MRVAVFGSSGFIGKNLVKSLGLYAEIQEISLREPSWASSVLADITVMINLIGKAHDHTGTATKEDFFHANVELTKQVFKVFAQSNAKTFIHISSLAAVEEYESDHPITENHRCEPQSFYGQSKKEAEKWLLSQKLDLNKNVIVLRPPMVHGPGDKGNLRLLYKFIDYGLPYPLAAFDNLRSFISIQNFNYFIEKIIKSPNSLNDGIYHIADDQAMSTKDLISVIQTITGKKIINFKFPKNLIVIIAMLGNVFPLPLNSKRLKKMTSNLTLSNAKIKTALRIEKLPFTATQGLEITIRSFINL